MRMQPCDAAAPIVSFRSVPWMQYFGSLKKSFTCFIGFFGSFGAAGCLPFDQFAFGGTHAGFQTMCRTPKRPIGVGCFDVPTATSYFFTSCPLMRTTRIFFCVETAMESGEGAAGAAMSNSERRNGVMPTPHCRFYAMRRRP